MPRQHVSVEDPITGEWSLLSKFGSLAKAVAFCKKLELKLPYRESRDFENRIHLCIEGVD